MFAELPVVIGLGILLLVGVALVVDAVRRAIRERQTDRDLHV